MHLYCIAIPEAGNNNDDIIQRPEFPDLYDT
jgi:hypothetical protein